MVMLTSVTTHEYNDTAELERAAVPGEPPDEPVTSRRLHLAVQSGRRRAVRRALLHCRDVTAVDAGNQLSQTPLFVACLLDHAGCVELLLAYGADANARCGPSGHTPTHAACMAGSERVLGHLLQYGADLRLCDLSGHTPADWARQQPEPRRRLAVLRLIERVRLAALTAAPDARWQYSAVGGGGGGGGLRSLVRAVMPAPAHVGRQLLCGGFSPVASSCVGSSSLPTAKLRQLTPAVDGALEYHVGAYTLMSPREFMRSPVCVRHMVCVDDATSDNCGGGGGGADLPQDRGPADLLIGEADALRRLRHPSLLLLMAVASTDNGDGLALVFEPVPLGSLFHHVHRRRLPLTAKQLARIVLQVCSALNYLHASGWIHCAVTSHAVHLISASRAKLAGLEYAVRIAGGTSSTAATTTTATTSSRTSTSSSSWGSTMTAVGDGHRHHCHARLLACTRANCLYGWLAPELLALGAGQASIATVGPAVDVYSLCVLLWEAVHQRVPWRDLSGACIRRLLVEQRQQLEVIPRLCPPYVHELLSVGLCVSALEARDLQLHEVRFMMTALAADRHSWHALGRDWTPCQRSSAAARDNDGSDSDCQRHLPADDESSVGESEQAIAAASHDATLPPPHRRRRGFTGVPTGVDADAAAADTAGCASPMYIVDPPVVSQIPRRPRFSVVRTGSMSRVLQDLRRLTTSNCSSPLSPTEPSRARHSCTLPVPDDRCQTREEYESSPHTPISAKITGFSQRVGRRSAKRPAPATPLANCVTNNRCQFSTANISPAIDTAHLANSSATDASVNLHRTSGCLRVNRVVDSDETQTQHRQTSQRTRVHETQSHGHTKGISTSFAEKLAYFRSVATKDDDAVASAGATHPSSSCMPGDATQENSQSCAAEESPPAVMTSTPRAAGSGSGTAAASSPQLSEPASDVSRAFVTCLDVQSSGGVSEACTTADTDNQHEHGETDSRRDGSLFVSCTAECSQSQAEQSCVSAGGCVTGNSVVAESGGGGGCSIERAAKVIGRRVKSPAVKNVVRFEHICGGRGNSADVRLLRSDAVSAARASDAEAPRYRRVDSPPPPLVQPTGACLNGEQHGVFYTDDDDLTAFRSAPNLRLLGHECRDNDSERSSGRESSGGRLAGAVGVCLDDGACQSPLSMQLSGDDSQASGSGCGGSSVDRPVIVTDAAAGVDSDGSVADAARRRVGSRCLPLLRRSSDGVYRCAVQCERGHTVTAKTSAGPRGAVSVTRTCFNEDGTLVSRDHQVLTDASLVETEVVAPHR